VNETCSMELGKGIRVSCIHTDGALLGTVERVNSVTIRVLFDGESKSRLIKKKPGFYEIVPLARRVPSRPIQRRKQTRPKTTRTTRKMKMTSPKHPRILRRVIASPLHPHRRKRKRSERNPKPRRGQQPRGGARGRARATTARRLDYLQFFRPSTPGRTSLGSTSTSVALQQTDLYLRERVSSHTPGGHCLRRASSLMTTTHITGGLGVGPRWTCARPHTFK